MYVVTFYSFKGGSGRSMSLVNVAAALAQAGRKVLIVDFDLEAPGIGEFELVGARTPSKGIVEFVSDYLATGIVPSVSEYIYSSNEFPSSGGKLMVMPAGLQDHTYQQRFSAINWNQLYDENDGYLLMEDLRLQWEKMLDCDYVFVDSRTGYTDIGGICTRQLPDAVCLVFSPNKQNLSGLAHVVGDIREQAKVPGLRHPKMHFVVSNVPVMDDENQLLASALSRCKEKLQYDAPCVVIHHYNSFALLNEEVFTLRYPNTILSTEYRALANQISEQNFGDRLSVLEFLKSVISDYPSGGKGFNAAEVEDRLLKVVGHFANDPDILYLVSRVKRISGDIEQSRDLLELAIERGCTIPRAFLDRAVFSDRENESKAAWDDVKRALESKSRASSTDVLLAIRIGLRLGSSNFTLYDFSNSNAVKSLDNSELLYVCATIDDSLIGAELCVQILRDIFDWTSNNKDELDTARIALANCYIAVGELKLAIEIFSGMTVASTNVQLVVSFNLGMSLYWSGQGDLAKNQFSVCQMLFSNLEDQSPNRLQCEAFTLWALGNSRQAFEKLQDLESKLAESSPRRYFSCWRYYSATAKEFASDIASMKVLFSGEAVLPEFLQGNDSV